MQTMIEKECIPARNISHLRTPDDGFHLRQFHLLSIDQFDAPQTVKRADGVIKPMIDVQPGLRQKRNGSIRFARQVWPADFNNIADVVFAGSGEKMKMHLER